MIFDHVAGRLSHLDREVVEAVPPGGNWRDLPPSFQSSRVAQIRRSAAAGEGSRSTYYGRLRLDRPSYTISTYFSRPGNGCFIHPVAPRLITAREAARFQTFPDAYRFVGSSRAVNMQIGNAVPPVLAYQIARVLPRGPVVDLFSGAGGLSLGFDWAGFPLIAAVDRDATALETLSRNRTDDTTMVADLSDTATHRAAMREIRRRAGSDGIRVLAGGPPCQGFSTAGNCRLDDPRNQLVFAFLSAAEALRPDIVLMENVPALMWRGREGILREARGWLRRLGYDTSVIVAHAEGYGVPQLRRRLFLMGSRSGRPTWPVPWREILPPASRTLQPGGASDAALPPPVSVYEAIGDLPYDEAPASDVGVAYRFESPTSSFQGWARGDSPLSSLVPDAAAGSLTPPSRQLELLS